MNQLISDRAQLQKLQDDSAAASTPHPPLEKGETAEDTPPARPDFALGGIAPSVVEKVEVAASSNVIDVDDVVFWMKDQSQKFKCMKLLESMQNSKNSGAITVHPMTLRVTYRDHPEKKGSHIADLIYILLNETRFADDPPPDFLTFKETLQEMNIPTALFRQSDAPSKKIDSKSAIDELKKKLLTEPWSGDTARA